MLYMHILRIKCEVQAQGNLLSERRNPSDVISESIRATPTAQVGRGSEWHVGNVESVDDGIAFAMGRTALVTAPQFDQVAHSFREEEVERAPFTFGVFDPITQSCGVLRKGGVSQSAREIATKLGLLLNAAGLAAKANSYISVDPVPDPTNFLKSIGEAYAITRFIFTVSRPNPHDVNKLIQRPAQEFTLLTNGIMTKVEVDGDKLDQGVLQETTNAIAASGDYASADIRLNEGDRTKRIYLRGSPLLEPVEDAGTTGLFKNILDGARIAYARVRRSDQ